MLLPKTISEDRNKPCNNLEMLSNRPQKVKMMLFLLSHKCPFTILTPEWCLPLKWFYSQHKIETFKLASSLSDWVVIT